jgi:regulator of sigma E protease
MNALTDLVAYIGFLTVVIGMHEFGHFVVAKRFGLVASIFSFGFGKVLFARKDKAGTSWQIRALPFGGFIKLDEDRLAALPPLQRIAIYVAGPAVNIAAGVVLIAIAGIELGTPALKALEISLQAVPQIVSTLFSAIGDLLWGKIANLSGPVGAAMASGDAVRVHGVAMFAALFSWSVGFLNLLPVPLLDGGQIVLCGIEIIAGKPGEDAMKYAAWAGRSFIGCLILAGVASDLIRIVG